MALSQKHEGKQLVPWYSSSEWVDVYRKIYGPHANERSKNEALCILEIWETRLKHLPAGIQGTIIMLDAERSLDGDLETKYVQMLMSGAILRFLNVCVTNDARQGTFYKMARKMRVPSWLISLRHDIAHGQTLPSIDILRCAMRFSFEWLHFEYWKPVRANLQDYILSTELREKMRLHFTDELNPLVGYYLHLCLGMHPLWGFRYISDIKDPAEQQELIVTLSTSKKYTVNVNTKMERALEILLTMIDEVMASPVDDKNNILIDLIIENSCFMCDIEDYNRIFEDTSEMPTDFLFLWQDLLKYLQGAGLLDMLIRKLIYIAYDRNAPKIHKICAPLWLIEISKALIKCNKAQTLIGKINIPTNASVEQASKLLMQSYEKTDRNLVNVLRLHLFCDMPEILKDWSLFQYVLLQEPDDLAFKYIPYMLRAHQAVPDEIAVEKIMKLTDLYMTLPKKRPGQTLGTNIYMACTPAENSAVQSSACSDVTVTPKRFWKAKDVCMSTCPLGKLPWQKMTWNPIL